MTGKLVRDRIPEIIRAAGGTPVVETVTDPERYRALLFAKLREEAGELAEAGCDQDATEELADLREVLHALAAAYGVDWARVRAAGVEKAARSGAFTQRLYLHR